MFHAHDCDMQFKTEKEREKHMQSEHAHVPQFPCHLCGLTYLARSATGQPCYGNVIFKIRAMQKITAYYSF